MEKLIYFILEVTKYLHTAIDVVLLLEQDRVLLLEDTGLMYHLVEDREEGISLLNSVCLLLLKALGLKVVLDQGNL